MVVISVIEVPVFVKVHWSPAVDLAVVISWEVLANQPSYPFVHRDKRYCPWSHLGGVLSSETDFSIGDACWLNWFWPALTVFISIHTSLH